ncbi:hypothetical protein QBC44DRAFT_366286 [Cladorrhinum sp. PSN332]|nr:hypothetical protein QBC44DRAFT_366286 [Cladorrhinum sp. PSN332]
MTSNPIDEVDLADLAERGELEKPELGNETTSIETSAEISPTEVDSSEAEGAAEKEDEEKEQEEHIDDATGQTGCARRKQASHEWLFFPACEREFCLVLEYWCYKARRTRLAIEELERRNKEEGREDYKKHLPDHADDEYGKEKERLMNQLTAELEKYRDFFYQANGIISQPAPQVRYVNEFREWAWTRVAHDPVDDSCAAENYRVLGRPQSTIEGFIHDAYITLTTAWYQVRYNMFNNFLVRVLCRRPKTTNSEENVAAEGKEEQEGREEEAEFALINYSVFHVFSHLLIISLALTFLVLPLVLMYLLNLKILGGVVVTVVFCLLFCVGSFVFAGENMNTDHKFLLLFAYTGVIATLLSKFHDGDGNKPGGGDAECGDLGVLKAMVEKACAAV